MKKNLTWSFLGLLLIGAGCARSTTTTDVQSTTPPPAGRDETRAIILPSDQDTINVPLLPINKPPATTVQPSAPITSDKQPVDSPTIKTFTLTAKRWSFEPATITVNRDDLVKLNIRSLDVTHGFSLPAFNVDQTLTAGQTTTVEFTADRTGTFDFACSVFCGEGHTKMTGSVIVR